MAVNGSVGDRWETVDALKYGNSIVMEAILELIQVESNRGCVVRSRKHLRPI
jgi:hypothetical protein